MLSGLIFKKTPEAGTLFSCHSSCTKWQLQDSESSGCGQAASASPSPRQNPKENKLKLWLKYIYYNAHCTQIWMYISDLNTKLSLMFQNFS